MYSLPKSETDLDRICHKLKMFLFPDMTIYEKVRLLVVRNIPAEMHKSALDNFARSLGINFKDDIKTRVWDEEDSPDEEELNDEETKSI